MFGMRRRRATSIPNRAGLRVGRLIHPPRLGWHAPPPPVLRPSTCPVREVPINVGAPNSAGHHRLRSAFQAGLRFPQECDALSTRLSVLDTPNQTKVMKQFIRAALRYRISASVYLIIGGLSAGVNWLVFAICLEFRLYYLLAATWAFLLATAFNWILSEKYGFRRGAHHRLGRFALVCAISTAGFGVDLTVLALCTEVFNCSPFVGKVFGTAAAFVLNYLGRQFIAFDREPKWRSWHDVTIARLRPDPD